MDYKKKYEDALLAMKQRIDSGVIDECYAEEIFPELKESEDERIRKALIDGFKRYNDGALFNGCLVREIIAWLEKQGDVLGKRSQEIVNNMLDAKLNGLQRELIEFLSNTVNASWKDVLISSDCYAERIKNVVKQGEQKPAMIQWKGDNLKEVIDFTGVYKEGFEKWFHNSWEEYEKYVHKHNNIFKIFNEDGSHIEVPVGAWIVKTPDGYNTASRYVFRQKPAVWSEEDEKNMKEIILFCNTLIFGNMYSLSNERLKSILQTLKSLRPQSHWKPSEEQLYALDYILNYHVFGDTNIREKVQSLYDDLKKL